MKCITCNKELNKKQASTYHNNIYCPKHYQQMLKHGHTLDTIQRTTHDLNDYEFLDDYCVKIITYNRKCIKSGSFIISRCDFDRVIKKKWRIWRDRVFTGNYEPISISTFIIGKENIPNNMVIDHINHNPFDNRRENLRVITQQQNTINKSIMKINTSLYSGVWYDNQRDKWCAEIKKDDIKCYLGRYVNLHDAVYARYEAEKILFSEYRNFSNDENIIKEIDKCEEDRKNKINKYVKSRLHKKYVNIPH